jgi:hypothetical protein
LLDKRVAEQDGSQWHDRPSEANIKRGYGQQPDESHRLPI